jgi:L-alanine-DL-glutamate epimerase-like enolase superfamily enzyme
VPEGLAGVCHVFPTRHFETGAGCCRHGLAGWFSGSGLSLCRLVKIKAIKAMGLHSGTCSLIRFYASMPLVAVIQNFFQVENALGAWRGNQKKMAHGPEPAVRKTVFPVPEDPGPGLDLNS